MTNGTFSSGRWESFDWDAIARYLAGESPPDEAAAIASWLRENPAEAERIATLDRWLGVVEVRPPEDLDLEAALARVRARFEEPVVHALEPRRTAAGAVRRSGQGARLVRTAAALVLVVGGPLLIWAVSRGGGPQAGPQVAQRIETSIGERDSLRLADGSRVLLAPGSGLTVAPGFGTDRREVLLSGEALFEVEHDEARPFVVRAGGALIEDLGTVFTIRSAPGEGVRVAVTEGSVLLRPADSPGADGVTLREGDRGALEQNGRLSVERGAVTEGDLSWTRGVLTFRDAPLARVRTDLRRWYGYELRFAEPSLEERRLTATFAGEPLAQVSQIIALALGGAYELRGDTAIISTAGPR